MPPVVIVEKSGLYKVPFSRADSEAVQVDHYRVAVLILEYVPNVGVSVDNARRQREIQPGVLVLEPD